jgi:hypothetical protein
VESFPVSPAHTPSAVVVVRNLLETPYEGQVSVAGPTGWNIDPSQQSVRLAAGETQKVRFLVKRGTSNAENAYALTVSAEGAGTRVTHKQRVMAASAPYFKPTIDGQIDDWKDAIPVTWETHGKRTTVSTYWNRRQFSFLIAVEEDRLAAADAVQIAMSPQDVVISDDPASEIARYEFLLAAAGGDGAGRCYQLASPGMTLAETQQPRELSGLLLSDAKLYVRREQTTTHYEGSIPFSIMRDRIRPSEGREFRMSILVHDPDGSGLRDWGQAAGLWPWQRNRLAWSNWQGAPWGEEPPFENTTVWGLCSSKY